MTNSVAKHDALATIQAPLSTLHKAWFHPTCKEGEHGEHEGRRMKERGGGGTVFRCAALRCVALRCVALRCVLCTRKHLPRSC